MLVRVIAIWALAVFSGCRHSAESKLVGGWRWKGCNDAGEVDGGDIVYSADHTFHSREWAVNYSQQPPILEDRGEWHIRRGQLVMDFKGDTRSEGARHAEFPFVFFDSNAYIIRTSDGRVNTFQRVK